MDNWIVSGREYSKTSSVDFTNKLENKVYILKNNITKGFYLEEVDSFSIRKPIFDFDDAFMARVIERYHTSNINLGVLLIGKRGTGKTLLCKRIITKLNLPTIIIEEHFEGEYTSFIQSIEQEIVLLYDEFEKTHEDYDEALLSLLDGALTTKYKRLFLFTANNVFRIDENYLERPGRVRYIKVYNNLTKEQLDVIVSQELHSKHNKKEVIKELLLLNTISLDTVLTVIEELNETNMSIKEVLSILNVDDHIGYKSKYANYFLIKDNKKHLICEGLHNSNLTVGDRMHLRDYTFMIIKKEESNKYFVKIESIDEDNKKLKKLGIKETDTIEIHIEPTKMQNFSNIQTY